MPASVVLDNGCGNGKYLQYRKDLILMGNDMCSGLLDVQNRFGAQQQQQMQNALNTEYQDFLNFQNYPYKQLGFMSDMIRGLPLTQQSQTMYAQPPSMIQQAAGLGITGKALGAFAEGGSVDDQPAGLADLAIYRMGQD